jgi:hypothetical protein
MWVPDAYTIRRKVGFFLKRLEIPVESLELAASRAGDQLGSRESVSLHFYRTVKQLLDRVEVARVHHFVVMRIHWDVIGADLTA